MVLSLEIRCPRPPPAAPTSLPLAPHPRPPRRRAPGRTAVPRGWAWAWAWAGTAVDRATATTETAAGRATAMAGTAARTTTTSTERSGFGLPQPRRALFQRPPHLLVGGLGEVLVPGA